MKVSPGVPVVEEGKAPRSPPPPPTCQKFHVWWSRDHDYHSGGRIIVSAQSNKNTAKIPPNHTKSHTRPAQQSAAIRSKRSNNGALIARQQHPPPIEGIEGKADQLCTDYLSRNSACCHEEILYQIPQVRGVRFCTTSKATAKPQEARAEE